LASLDEMVRGHMLADVVAVIWLSARSIDEREIIDHVREEIDHWVAKFPPIASVPR